MHRSVTDGRNGGLGGRRARGAGGRHAAGANRRDQRSDAARTLGAAAHYDAREEIAARRRAKAAAAKKKREELAYRGLAVSNLSLIHYQLGEPRDDPREARARRFRESGGARASTSGASDVGATRRSSVSSVASDRPSGAPRSSATRGNAVGGDSVEAARRVYGVRHCDARRQRGSDVPASTSIARSSSTARARRRAGSRRAGGTVAQAGDHTSTVPRGRHTSARLGFAKPQPAGRSTTDGYRRDGAQRTDYLHGSYNPSARLTLSGEAEQLALRHSGYAGGVHAGHVAADGDYPYDPDRDATFDRAGVLGAEIAARDEAIIQERRRDTALRAERFRRRPRSAVDRARPRMRHIHPASPDALPEAAAVQIRVGGGYKSSQRLATEFSWEADERGLVEPPTRTRHRPSSAHPDLGRARGGTGGARRAVASVLRSRTSQAKWEDAHPEPTDDAAAPLSREAWVEPQLEGDSRRGRASLRPLPGGIRRRRASSEISEEDALQIYIDNSSSDAGRDGPGSPDWSPSPVRDTAATQVQRLFRGFAARQRTEERVLRDTLLANGAKQRAATGSPSRSERSKKKSIMYFGRSAGGPLATLDVNSPGWNRADSTTFSDREKRIEANKKAIEHYKSQIRQRQRRFAGDDHKFESHATGETRSVASAAFPVEQQRLVPRDNMESPVTRSVDGADPMHVPEDSTADVEESSCVDPGTKELPREIATVHADHAADRLGDGDKSGGSETTIPRPSSERTPLPASTPGIATVPAQSSANMERTTGTALAVDMVPSVGVGATPAGIITRNTMGAERREVGASRGTEVNSRMLQRGSAVQRVTAHTPHAGSGHTPVVNGRIRRSAAPSRTDVASSRAVPVHEAPLDLRGEAPDARRHTAAVASEPVAISEHVEAESTATGAGDASLQWPVSVIPASDDTVKEPYVRGTAQKANEEVHSDVPSSFLVAAAPDADEQVSAPTVLGQALDSPCGSRAGSAGGSGEGATKQVETPRRQPVGDDLLSEWVRPTEEGTAPGLRVPRLSPVKRDEDSVAERNCVSPTTLMKSRPVRRVLSPAKPDHPHRKGTSVAAVHFSTSSRRRKRGHRRRAEAGSRDRSLRHGARENRHSRGDPARMNGSTHTDDGSEAGYAALPDSSEAASPGEVSQQGRASLSRERSVGERQHRPVVSTDTLTVHRLRSEPASALHAPPTEAEGARDRRSVKRAREKRMRAVREAEFAQAERGFARRLRSGRREQREHADDGESEDSSEPDGAGSAVDQTGDNGIEKTALDHLEGHEGSAAERSFSAASPVPDTQLTSETKSRLRATTYTDARKRVRQFSRACRDQEDGHDAGDRRLVEGVTESSFVGFPLDPRDVDAAAAELENCAALVIQNGYREWAASTSLGSETPAGFVPDGAGDSFFVRAGEYDDGVAGESATRIQSVVRGHRARVDKHNRHCAAVAVQSGFRGHVSRQRFLAQREAAVAVQSSYRAYSARRKVRRMRHHHQHHVASDIAVANYQIDAAGTVLSKADDAAEARDWAALQLQRVFRGHAGRQHTHQLREEHARALREAERRQRAEERLRRAQELKRREEERRSREAALAARQDEAAGTVQAAYRRSARRESARNARRMEVRRRNRAATTLQAAERGRHARRAYEGQLAQAREARRRNSAAVRVQTQIRGHHDRRRVETMRQQRKEARDAAATRVQAAVRGGAARKEASSRRRQRIEEAVAATAAVLDFVDALVSVALLSMRRTRCSQTEFSAEAGRLQRARTFLASLGAHTLWSAVAPYSPSGGAIRSLLTVLAAAGKVEAVSMLWDEKLDVGILLLGIDVRALDLSTIQRVHALLDKFDEPSAWQSARRARQHSRSAREVQRAARGWLARRCAARTRRHADQLRADEHRAAGAIVRLADAFATAIWREQAKCAMRFGDAVITSVRVFSSRTELLSVPEVSVRSLLGRETESSRRLRAIVGALFGCGAAPRASSWVTDEGIVARIVAVDLVDIARPTVQRLLEALDSPHGTDKWQLERRDRQRHAAARLIQSSLHDNTTRRTKALTMSAVEVWSGALLRAKFGHQSGAAASAAMQRLHTARARLLQVPTGSVVAVLAGLDSDGRRLRELIGAFFKLPRRPAATGWAVEDAITARLLGLEPDDLSNDCATVALSLLHADVCDTFTDLLDSWERKTVAIQRWIRALLQARAQRAADRLRQLNANAVSIEVCVRGFLARCKALRLRSERIERWDAAARQLQRWIADNQARQRQRSMLHERQSTAAVDIQRVARAHMARRRAYEARVHRFAEWRLQATKIQATFRGMLARRLYASLDRSRVRRLERKLRAWEVFAVEVQRVWRGYCGRQRALRLRHLRMQEWNDAAVVVQRHVRGHISRNHSQQLRAERNETLRMRELVNRMASAAAVVQRAYRRYQRRTVASSPPEGAHLQHPEGHVPHGCGETHQAGGTGAAGQLADGYTEKDHSLSSTRDFTLTSPTGDSGRLHEFLRQLRLEGYEAALRSLGVEAVDDFADVTDDDLVEVGMKRVQRRRLRRALAREYDPPGDLETRLESSTQTKPTWKGDHEAAWHTTSDPHAFGLQTPPHHAHEFVDGATEPPTSPKVVEGPRQAEAPRGHGWSTGESTRGLSTETPEYGGRAAWRKRSDRPRSWGATYSALATSGRGDVPEEFAVNAASAGKAICVDVDESGGWEHGDEGDKVGTAASIAIQRRDIDDGTPSADRQTAEVAEDGAARGTPETAASHASAITFSAVDGGVHGRRADYEARNPLATVVSKRPRNIVDISSEEAAALDDGLSEGDAYGSWELQRDDVHSHGGDHGASTEEQRKRWGHEQSATLRPAPEWAGSPGTMGTSEWSEAEPAGGSLELYPDDDVTRGQSHGPPEVPHDVTAEADVAPAAHGGAARTTNPLSPAASPAARDSATAAHYHSEPNKPATPSFERNSNSAISDSGSSGERVETAHARASAQQRRHCRRSLLERLRDKVPGARRFISIDTHNDGSAASEASLTPADRTLTFSAFPDTPEPVDGSERSNPLHGAKARDDAEWMAAGESALDRLVKPPAASAPPRNAESGNERGRVTSRTARNSVNIGDRPTDSDSSSSSSSGSDSDTSSTSGESGSGSSTSSSGASSRSDTSATSSASESVASSPGTTRRSKRRGVPRQKRRSLVDVVKEGAMIVADAVAQKRRDRELVPDPDASR